MDQIVISISEGGRIKTIYTDDIPWHELGEVQVERASDVEWVEGGWKVFLKDGTILPGCWQSRAEAIAAEVEFLQRERL